MKHHCLSLQLRLGAAIALRPALQFLLVTLVMIPVAALIGLLVHDERQIDWKLSMTVGGVLGLIWFVATFLSTLADLRKEDRIEAARIPPFPAQSFVSGLYGAITVFSMRAITGLYRDNEPLWLQLLPFGFVAIASYGWPRTTRCYETSISQRSLCGRKK